MIYCLKLKNGDCYEIGQIERDAVVDAISKKDKPDFLEIKSIGLLFATNSVLSIESVRQDPHPFLTREQEIAEVAKIVPIKRDYLA